MAREKIILDKEQVGGRWYFYNPSTLSFGYSQFVKKWGKRKNEDDWRRSDKKISTELENDSTAQNQNQEGGRESTNKKDPQYYKDKIPLTKEQVELGVAVRMACLKLYCK